MSPQNPRVLLIEFLDQNGVYLSKTAERKLETIFFREDFARADADQIGKLDFASRSVEQYHVDFAKHIDAQTIIERGIKVVADYGFGRVAAVLPRILGQFGCDVIALNAYVDSSKSPKTAEARAAMLPNLAQIVRTVKADLGVMFHNDGERLTLVDESGEVVDGDSLLSVLCVMVARTNPRARIAVPITAPSHIEAIVGLHGGTVERTKTDARSLMTLAAAGPRHAPDVAFAGDSSGGFIFSAFQPGFDSMVAFGKLLEMLSVTGLTLREIATELPKSHVVHDTVRCPWELKGRIMRELTHEAEESGRVDLIDGIKVYHDGGWSLVIPDASEPYFHVYAEAESEKAARTHLTRAAHRIEELRGDVA